MEENDLSVEAGARYSIYARNCKYAVHLTLTAGQNMTYIQKAIPTCPELNKFL